MTRKTGSWPFLLGALVLFLALFAWRRADSTFLAIEAEIGAARVVAAQASLAVADALALRDLVGAQVAEAQWQQAALQFAGLRSVMGDELAAVAVAGQRAAAEAALAAGGGDAAVAWRQFRVEPAALPGLRFAAMRARFAARLPAADRDD